MKRSEALSELAVYLGECARDGFTREETAEAILNLMDEWGFLPPEIKVTFPLKKMDGTTQQSYTLVNRWEPEAIYEIESVGAWTTIADATGYSDDT